MPTLTLNRADIEKLAAFINKHSIKQFFIAKDHGAYVGASIGDKENCIFYFKGCDPAKDADFYDTARAKFGGDDFGEHFDSNAVIAAVADAHVKSMKFTVTASMVKVESFK